MNRPDLAGLSCPDPNRLTSSITDLVDARSDQVKSHFHILYIYMLFMCSGMASLICETVWFKQLQFVLGSSTFSVSVVVASFFGGLAFGGWLGGAWPIVSGAC